MACRSLALIAAAGLAAGCGVSGPPPAAPSADDGRIVGETSYVPTGTPLELGLAGYAKVLCSAVFVSERDPVEAFRNSGFMFMPPQGRAGIEAPEIDRLGRSVTLRIGALARTARHYGDQGCVLDPADGSTIHFTSVPVQTSLGDAEGQMWPMGDRLPAADEATGVDTGHLDRAVEAAMQTDGLTAAFMVTHKGRIIAERYGQGAGRDTQLESWSMGKSVIATLVGLLIHEGEFSLDDAAPVPEWQSPADPRSEIRIADLMHMSSGLNFTAPRDPDFSPESGYPDHMYIYSGAIDSAAYSVNRPLEFPPNTEGRYRNSDPLTLAYIVRRTVEARGQNSLQWPQKALFDRLGIRRQVLEPDPWGNFLLTGYDYGTARNWARLGNLYLQDGVWEGERLLPEGFVDFVSTQAPAWDEPVYGGLFWLNGTGVMPIPRDAYYMAGGGGQRVVIVPSHELVVVRLGHFRGDAPGMVALNTALEHLMQAVPESR